ncbi:hypothetical protein B0T13DRAFT_451900 [Neurospora crassa]|nr:hypothetical protein B0T13DRAFT_451900 [Neurospora crassa]
MALDLSRKPPRVRLPEAVPLVAQRDGGNCPKGYQWYTCNVAQGISYAGCCAMDPCRPDMVDCPDRYKPGGEDTTTTITKTATATASAFTSTESDKEPSWTSTTSDTSSTSTISSPSSTPSATVTATPDAPPIVVHKELSAGAIAGIAVGCSLAFIFFAISVCMWWGRRRAKKDEKKDAMETANVSSFLDPTDRSNPAETRQDKNVSQSGFHFPLGSYQPVPTRVPCEYRGQDATSSGSPTNTNWPGSPMDYESHRFSGATTMSTPASHNSASTPASPNCPSRSASELDSTQAYQQGGWGKRFEPMHEIPELETNERPPQHTRGPNN